MFASLSSEGVSDPEAISMSRPPVPSFTTRLAVARAMLARGAPAAPVHLADQFRAASADTRELHDRIGVLMPLLEPGRHWRQRMDSSPSDRHPGVPAGRAPRLHRGLPAPEAWRPSARVRAAAAPPDRLPAVRADAQAPAGRRGRPLRRVRSARDADVPPVRRPAGPALIVGDACPACADVLGIRAEVAS